MLTKLKNRFHITSCFRSLYSRQQRCQRGSFLQMPMTPKQLGLHLNPGGLTNQFRKIEANMAQAFDCLLDTPYYTVYTPCIQVYSIYSKLPSRRAVRLLIFQKQFPPSSRWQYIKTTTTYLHGCEISGGFPHLHVIRQQIQSTYLLFMGSLMQYCIGF